MSRPRINQRTLLSAPICLAILSGLSSAQVRQPGQPAGLALTGEVPVLDVPVPNVAALRLEDAYNLENGVPGPLRYGLPIQVEASSESAGRWDVTPEGDLVWRLKISAPGAHSIGVEFSHYELPQDAQVFLYSEDMRTSFGAYTSYHNQPTHELAIEPFPGDELIVEYRQSAANSAESRVVIGRVIYDYQNIFAMERRLDELETQSGSGGGGGADGGCTVNVNCPSGDPFPDQKRASVRTLAGGGLCSGSLINNTANDGAQYLYTANHCGQGSTTVVRFNYQSANCNGSGGTPTNQNVSGCTVLATHTSSDGRLLRINNNIPASYNEYWSGWSRATQSLSFGLSMTHPSGGPKCIAIDSNGGGQSSANFQGIGVVQVWSMNFQTGGTLGGSSGGPLFDQNNRIRGALTGGPASSCAQSLYGRFHTFWNNSNISSFLDPTGSGVTNHDGFDPSDPGSGPGGAPNIASVSPGVVTAVNSSPVTVTLTGSGFTGTQKVTVGGVELASFPPQFAVIDDSTLNFSLPLLPSLGSHTIEVENADGTGTNSLSVSANLTPELNLVNSDPAFLLSALGAELQMGSLPGDLCFLMVSPLLGNTTLPGLFSAGVGNGSFNALIYLGSFTIGSAKGYAEIQAPFNLPTGFKLHFQMGVLSSVLPVLPLSMSNIQSGTVLF